MYRYVWNDMHGTFRMYIYMFTRIHIFMCAYAIIAIFHISSFVFRLFKCVYYIHIYIYIIWRYLMVVDDGDTFLAERAQWLSIHLDLLGRFKALPPEKRSRCRCWRLCRVSKSRLSIQIVNGNGNLSWQWKVPIWVARQTCWIARGSRGVFEAS